MKKIIPSILLFTFLFSTVLFPQNKVIIAQIDREVDLAMSPYISRVINQAESNNVQAIILMINTFGGRLDAATQIKDAILNSKVPVIAFVNKRAVSAGSLIALSCDKIIMVPGSLIGAASVVDEQGTKMSEKYQSYMRSEMRSTAERRGKRTDIAEGMVDERIVVPDINDDSTKLITLTSEEALRVKIADTVLSNLSQVYSYLDIKNPQVVKETSTWAENLVKFLNNPIVSSILIMIGFLGIMSEIKAPGWGVGGTAAVIALALFFGSSYIVQLASIFEIVLFVVGIGLLALEIFVIPGFGITGVLGIVLIFASIFMSLMGNYPFWDSAQLSRAGIQMLSALTASIVFIFMIAKYLPKSKTFNKLVLTANIGKGKEFAIFPGEKELLNAEGVALTTLRPAGTALINGKRIDVITEGEYLPNDTKIKVMRIEGIKVVVKEIV